MTLKLVKGKIDSYKKLIRGDSTQNRVWFTRIKELKKQLEEMKAKKRG